MRTLVATREASSELIDLLRDLCRSTARPVDDTEIRGALALASARDEAALRKLARRDPPAPPLGPLAWLDVARGVDPAVAAARELGGYYLLLAERDALVAMLNAREPKVRPAGQPGPADAPKGAPADAPKPARAPQPARAPEPARATQPAREAKPARPPEPARAPAPRARARTSPDLPRRTRRSAGESAPSVVRKHRPTEATAPEPEPGLRAQQEARAQHLLGLFAYHRDAPLVARALGVARAELERELDLLNLRRKAFRLVRGLDSDLPAATAIKGVRGGPPVRRRKRTDSPTEPPPKPAAPVPPPPPLKAALEAIGARRAVLAARLDIPAADLLARLRDAGLEREFAAAERDLIRELYARHRGSQRAVAKDLGASESDLRALISERSLSLEVDRLRERYRREARQDFRWPRDRIEQVLRERVLLEDLGIWEELHREVTVRAQLLWKDVRKKPDALELLQKTLRITPADARELRRMLDLR